MDEFNLHFIITCLTQQSETVSLEIGGKDKIQLKLLKDGKNKSPGTWCSESDGLITQVPQVVKMVVKNSDGEEIRSNSFEINLLDASKSKQFKITADFNKPESWKAEALTTATLLFRLQGAPSEQNDLCVVGNCDELGNCSAVEGNRMEINNEGILEKEIKFIFRRHNDKLVPWKSLNDESIKIGFVRIGGNVDKSKRKFDTLKLACGDQMTEIHKFVIHKQWEGYLLYEETLHLKLIANTKKCVASPIATISNNEVELKLQSENKNSGEYFWAADIENVVVYCNTNGQLLDINAKPLSIEISADGLERRRVALTFPGLYERAFCLLLHLDLPLVEILPAISAPFLFQVVTNGDLPDDSCVKISGLNCEELKNKIQLTRHNSQVHRGTTFFSKTIDIRVYFSGEKATLWNTSKEGNENDRLCFQFHLDGDAKPEICAPLTTSFVVNQASHDKSLIVPTFVLLYDLTEDTSTEMSLNAELRFEIHDFPEDDACLHLVGGRWNLQQLRLRDAIKGKKLKVVALSVYSTEYCGLVAENAQRHLKVKLFNVEHELQLPKSTLKKFLIFGSKSSLEISAAESVEYKFVATDHENGHRNIYVSGTCAELKNQRLSLENRMEKDDSNYTKSITIRMCRKSAGNKMVPWCPEQYGSEDVNFLLIICDSEGTREKRKYKSHQIVQKRHEASRAVVFRGRLNESLQPMEEVSVNLDFAIHPDCLPSESDSASNRLRFGSKTCDLRKRNGHQWWHASMENILYFDKDDKIVDDDRRPPELTINDDKAKLFTLSLSDNRTHFGIIVESNSEEPKIVEIMEGNFVFAIEDCPSEIENPQFASNCFEFNSVAPWKRVNDARIIKQATVKVFAEGQRIQLWNCEALDKRDFCFWFQSDSGDSKRVTLSLNRTLEAFAPTFIIIHKWGSELSNIKQNKELRFEIRRSDFNQLSFELKSNFGRLKLHRVAGLTDCYATCAAVLSNGDDAFKQNKMFVAPIDTPDSEMPIDIESNDLQSEKILVKGNFGKNLKGTSCVTAKYQFRVTGCSLQYDERLYVVGDCVELGNGQLLKENRMRYDKGLFHCQSELLLCILEGKCIPWSPENFGQSSVSHWFEIAGRSDKEPPRTNRKLLTLESKPEPVEVKWEGKSSPKKQKVKLKFVISCDKTDVKSVTVRISDNPEVKLTVKDKLWVADELVSTTVYVNSSNSFVDIDGNTLIMTMRTDESNDENVSLKFPMSRQDDRFLVSAVCGSSKNFAAVASYVGDVKFRFRVKETPLCEVKRDEGQSLFILGNCSELEKCRCEWNSQCEAFEHQLSIEMCKIDQRLVPWNPLCNKSLVVSFSLAVCNADDIILRQELGGCKSWKLANLDKISPGKSKESFVINKNWNEDPIVLKPSVIELKLDVDCEIYKGEYVKSIVMEGNFKQEMERKENTQKGYKYVEKWKKVVEITVYDDENRYPLSIDGEPLQLNRITGTYSYGIEGDLKEFKIDVGPQRLPSASKTSTYRIKAVIRDNFTKADVCAAPKVNVKLYFACTSANEYSQMYIFIKSKCEMPLKHPSKETKDTWMGEEAIEMYNYDGALLLENEKPLRLRFHGRFQMDANQKQEEKFLRTPQLSCDAAAGDFHFWYNARFDEPNSEPDVPDFATKVQLKFEAKFPDEEKSDCERRIVGNIRKLKNCSTKLKSSEGSVTSERAYFISVEHTIVMYNSRGELFLPGGQRLRVKRQYHRENHSPIELPDEEWREIRLFSDQLGGDLHFNIDILPKNVHRVFPNMPMNQLPRDSILHAFQSALHSALPDLPEATKSFEVVRDTFAKYLVPAIKQNGDYVDGDSANRPHEFHDIWGEDPDSDLDEAIEQEEPEPRSPMMYVRMKHQKNPRSARNFAFDAHARLNAKYHAREGLVFSHLRDIAQTCELCKSLHDRYEYHGKNLCEFDQPVLHDDYIDVLTRIARNLTGKECECRVDSQLLLQHSAAIVRGRLDGFLVGKKSDMLSDRFYYNWKRHTEASSSWFVLLVAVWHKCQGKIYGRRTKFEDAIKEPEKKIPKFYMWPSQAN